MSRDQRLIFAAAGTRAVAVGLAGVLFSLYLARGGLHAGQIGILIAAGLAGAAAGTFWVSFFADRFGRRRTLVLLSGLSAAGGLGLALHPHFFLLLPVCFLGMVNAMGRERGALFTLDQAILPETAALEGRTRVLAWYSLTLDAGMAVGSLAAGLPVLLRQTLGLGELPSYQAAFFLYALLNAASALLYGGLTPRAEIHRAVALPSGWKGWRRIPRRTKRILTRLSLLFGFDSFAGGFLPGTLIAYWFFRRFGAGEELLSILFFLGYGINALSYLAAAWMARRVGLLNTMVFTHVPASLAVIAIPFAPTLGIAMALYLVREFLAEMDVPTRQSYVMGLVEPRERTLASGVTNLTRVFAWAVAPGFAGYAMRGLSLSFPLFVGGGLKILYDLWLYRAFRHIKPPEETGVRPGVESRGLQGSDPARGT